MPGKKRPTKPSDGGPLMVILEEIRSQNRATLEAVEAHHQEVRQELQDFRAETHSDVRILKAAVQGIAAELAALREQVTRTDAVITADYRERLHRLEERVEALERRS